MMTNADVTAFPGGKSRGSLSSKEAKDEISARRIATRFHQIAELPDDPAFLPEPREPGPWTQIVEPFYRNIVGELRRMVARADLNDPREFHGLLFMVVRLGGNSQAIAQDQLVSKTVVSRWICAAQTPVPERRRGILESALLSLEKAVKERTVVPLAIFTGKRAHSAVG